jgi:hypothetical protein
MSKPSSVRHAVCEYRLNGTAFVWARRQLQAQKHILKASNREVTPRLKEALVMLTDRIPSNASLLIAIFTTCVRSLGRSFDNVLFICPLAVSLEMAKRVNDDFTRTPIFCTDSSPALMFSVISAVMLEESFGVRRVPPVWCQPTPCAASPSADSQRSPLSTLLMPRHLQKRFSAPESERAESFAEGNLSVNTVHFRHLKVNQTGRMRSG